MRLEELDFGELYRLKEELESTESDVDYLMDVCAETSSQRKAFKRVIGVLKKYEEIINGYIHPNNAV